MSSGKIAPPEFIDYPSEYAEYKRKLQRWSRLTKTDKKQQAELVVYHLEGHPSGIQSKIDTALGDQIVEADDGLDKLIKYLDGIYAEDEMTDALRKYKIFTKLHKKKDQSVTDFIAEYERAHLKAKESGCDFSDTILAFNLLEACRLSDTDEKFILTAIDFKSGKEKKDLFEQVKNSLRKFQNRDSFCNVGEDSKMVVKKEEVLIEGVKDVLLAEGWKPPVKTNSNPEGKKNYLLGGKPVKCFRCGSDMHLIKDCDQQQAPPRNSQPVETRLKSSAENSEGSSKKQKKKNKKGSEKPASKSAKERVMLSQLLEEHCSAKNISMVCQVFEDKESCDDEVVLIEHKKTELSLLLEDAGYRGVLDSACSRSCAGRSWIKGYTQKISPSLASRLIVSHSNKVFQFGGGETRRSQGCIQLPAILGDMKIDICVDMVDAEIPLLIGSNSMEVGEAVLNFREMKATFFEQEVEMIKIGSGHFCVELLSDNLQTHINDLDQRDTVVQQVLLSADTIDIKGLKKLHHLYGHTSAQKLLKFLQKAGKETSSLRGQLIKIEKTCDACVKSKQRKPLPKSAIPRVDNPNEIVTLDLKQCDDRFGVKNKYICYMIDMHSRLTRADFIRDKKPETIVECIMTHWVSIFGVMGGIHSDIGGEMSNSILDDVAHKLGVKLTTTSSYSPHQNGLNERNHATVDVMITRMMASDETMSPEMALCWALNAKNSLDNCHGYSPFQLHIGKNPILPSVTRDGPPAFENETRSESFAAHLNAMNSARQEFVKAESSSILKKALKSRVFPRGGDIVEGDWIYYNKRDGCGKGKVWKGPVKVTSTNGKKLFIDQGARLGTVCRDDAVKVGEEFWKISDREESVLEDEDNKDLSLDEDESESEEEEDEDEDEVEVQTSEEEESDSDEDEEEDTSVEEEEGQEEEVTMSEVDEVEEEASPSRESRDDEKETKFSHTDIKVGDVLSYVIPESEDKEFSMVKSRAGKVGGVSQFWWNVENKETGEQKSVNFEVVGDLEKVENVPSDEKIEALVVSVPRYLHKEPECVSAKETELKSWDEFGVYTEVEDQGQHCLNTNWVLVKKDGAVKARLCVRGDQEANKEEIKTDAPTAMKVNVKLFYLLAAYFGWSVRSADVKAAFLQGADLDREVYVRPPKERRVSGVIWRMVKRVYGLVDASRGFYLELNKVLLELGCSVSSLDPAMYMHYREDGSLGGMVLTHVDDLIHGSGDETFYNSVMEPLKQRFKFGREEEGEFRFVGLNVKQEKDSIEIHQDQYVDNLIVPTLEGYDDADEHDLLSEEDQAEFRTAVGKIGWVAQTSRPDLSYDHLILSTKLGCASVRDMKQAIKITRKMKVDGTSMRFMNMGPIEQWTLVGHGDAGYKSLPDKVSSCGGHVIMICNRLRGLSCVVNWRSRKLKRVVSSSTAAEALAINDCLDELFYVKCVLMELLGRQASDVPMHLFTDSKNLFDAVEKSTLIENARVRTDIAKVKESLRDKELNGWYHVSGKDMLADVLTKKGAPGFKLLNVLRKCECVTDSDS